VSTCSHSNKFRTFCIMVSFLNRRIITIYYNFYLCWFNKLIFTNIKHIQTRMYICILLFCLFVNQHCFRNLCHAHAITIAIDLTCPFIFPCDFAFEISRRVIFFSFLSSSHVVIHISPGICNVCHVIWVM